MANAHVHLTENLLSAFVLGKLPDAEQQMVENHLVECADCEHRAAMAMPADPLVGLIRSAVCNHLPAVAEIEAVTRDGEMEPTPSDLRGFAESPSLSLPGPFPETISKLGKYRVLRPLGWGGMGSVWLAEHQIMGRLVALKVIRPELIAKENAVERFRREVQAAAKLNHHHIATAYDAEQVGAVHFLVMEFIDGETLAERVKKGPLPVAEACQAIRDAALGLAHAHATGLVHRDVKPGNLMRSKDGLVKVLDFGLVAIQDSAPTITGENLVMGTTDYIAPEQAEDARAADARSDIYGLGCTLYHLLSGHVPYPELSPLRKIDAHRHQPASPLTHTPPGLAAIVEKMMAKAPRERFQTALEVADALNPYATGKEPVVNTLHGNAPRRGLRWLAAGLLLAALAGLAGALHFLSWPKHAPLNSAAPQGLVSLAPERTLQRHAARTRAVVFSADSQKLYSCDDNGRIYEWPVTGGEPSAEWNIGRLIYALALAGDGKTLLAVTRQQLYAWDLETHRESVRFPSVPLEEGLGDVAVSPDGRRAATVGGRNGQVRVWDLSEGKQQSTWNAAATNRPSIYAVAWSPDGAVLATAGDSGLALWRPETGQLAQKVLTQASLTSVAFSADGCDLYALGWEGLIWAFDRATGKQLLEINTHGFNAGGRLCVSPAGHVIAASQNEEVTIWHPFAKARLARLLGHERVTGRPTISPNGKWIAAGGDDQSVRVWRTPALPPLDQSPHVDFDRHVDLPAVDFDAEESRVVDFREIHGAGLGDLRSWLSDLPPTFRPVEVTARAGAAPPCFDAVSIRDGNEWTFDAKLDLDQTGVDHLKDFHAVREPGWSLRIVCAYDDGKNFPRHHIWIKDDRFWGVHGRPLGQLPEALRKWQLEDYHPARFYQNGRDPGRGSAVRPYGIHLEVATGPPWETFLELSEAEVATKLAEMRSKKKRPTALNAYGSGNQRTFALSLGANPKGRSWEYRHGMTIAQYEAALIEQKSLGRRPLAVTSEATPEGVRYAVLWLEYSPMEPR